METFKTFFELKNFIKNIKLNNLYIFGFRFKNIDSFIVGENFIPGNSDYYYRITISGCGEEKPGYDTFEKCKNGLINRIRKLK